MDGKDEVSMHGSLRITYSARLEAQIRHLQLQSLTLAAALLRSSSSQLSRVPREVCRKLYKMETINTI
jgi:hypothetical protein